MKRMIVLAVVAAMGMSAAQAQDAGFFVEVAAGQTKTDVVCLAADYLASEFAYPGSAVKSSCDDSSTTSALNVGYQFSPYVSAKIGYLDMGSVAGRVDVDDGYDEFAIKADLGMDGITAALSAHVPVGSFVFQATAGVYDWTAKIAIDVDINGGELGSASDKADDRTNFYGVGIGWNVNPNIQIRVETVRFADMELDEGLKEDVDNNTVSFRYMF